MLGYKNVCIDISTIDQENNCALCVISRRIRASTYHQSVSLPQAFDLIASSLLYIPACNYHNESTKKDDEYARTVIAAGSYENKLAWDLLEERVFPGGSRGLINSLYKKMAPIGILDSGGEKLYKFDLERPRLGRVIEKIIAGIYWHKNGSRIPDGYTINPYFWNPKMEGNQRNVILSLPIQYLGHPDVFQFRYGEVANDKNKVIIAMAFFEASHIILSWICSKNETPKVE